MPMTLTRSDDLAAAVARLDALTNWENRPRNTMRVGLEPMRDLMSRLGERRTGRSEPFTSAAPRAKVPSPR